MIAASNRRIAVLQISQENRHLKSSNLKMSFSVYKRRRRRRASNKKIKTQSHPKASSYQPEADYIPRTAHLICFIPLIRYKVLTWKKILNKRLHIKINFSISTLTHFLIC